MSQINELTPEQIAEFPNHIKKWTDIGLCTDPANRPEAEKAINKSYLLAGLNPPRKIVWCGSPYSQGIVRAIILNTKLTGSIDSSVRESVRASVGDSVLESVWASVGDSVRESVGDSVLESVRTSVGIPVLDSVRASVGDSVLASVRASVGNSVLESVWASVGDSVGNSVLESVWASVRNSVGISVLDSVRNSVLESARASIRASVLESARASIRASVLESARASIRASVEDSVWDSVYGSQDATWLSFYSYFKEICGLIDQTEKISGLMELALHAGWCLMHKDICWVSERQCILNRDERGRIHSLTEPAIAYPDGWAIYAVHGVRVPEYIINDPDKITIELIEQEENSEIRRIMIDQFDRNHKGDYLQKSGAKILSKHLDQFGREKILYRKDIKNDEPLVMLKVINSTPEPDGSYKEYFLRVPPDITDSKEADAWTFYKEKDVYAPMIET